MADQNNNRAPGRQLRWLKNSLCNFFNIIFNHISRFGIGYGFLFGASSTLITLVAIIWYGVLAYPLPWKVTDPRDPRFDVNQFRFSDYLTSNELHVIRACVLPKGTPKEYVDKVFLEIGGGKAEKIDRIQPEYNHPRLYKYKYSNLRSRIYHALWSEMSEDGYMLIRYDENFHIEPDLTNNKFLDCKNGDFYAK